AGSPATGRAAGAAEAPGFAARGLGLLQRAAVALGQRIVRAQMARADAELMRMAQMDSRIAAELDAARLRAERDAEERRNA
ncbi:MAG TPA: hypothetical protein VM491_15485, partial [Burkholderiaceae bacterium]|nr:hypothetical protein [Burkholderiaceae bacterium]